MTEHPRIIDTNTLANAMNSPTRATKRQAHSRTWWRTEATYINLQDPRDLGRNFNYSRECFAEYCDMQARFAALDGCNDIAKSIRKAAERARRAERIFRAERS